MNTIANSDDLELPTTLDKAIVEYIEDTLEWYEHVGILPPFHTYLTLLNGAEYTMFVPRRIWGPDHLREIGTDEFLFGELVIDRYDADVPTLLRKPLYRLWNRTGWSLSLNYNEIEEDGETRYQWDPPGLTNPLSTICKCPHF